MSKLKRVLITFLGGWFGLHKYLEGDVGMGVVYTFTVGLFYIGWIYDCIKALIEKAPKDLLRWQRIVIPSAPDKLVATTKQLNEASKMYTEGNIRVLNDSLNLISHTENPEVYFKRVNMVLECYNNLADIEEFFTTGVKPVESLLAFEDKLPSLTQEFIKRYWQKTLNDAGKLKTTKAREKRLQKLKKPL